MAGACVMWSFTPVAENVDVLGLVPYPLAEGEACPPDALMVMSSADVTDMQAKAANNLLSLSYEDGVILSGLVATVWCAAWAIRAVRKAL